MQDIFSNIGSNSFAQVAKVGFGPGALLGVLVVVFLVLYGLGLGRTRALISLFGIYIAYSIQAVFPYHDWVYNTFFSSRDISVSQITFFLVIYVSTFLILNKSAVKSRLTLHDVSFVSIFIISTLQLGLIVSVITNMMGQEAIANYPDIIKNYFATPTTLFYWFVIPMIAVIFVDKK